MAGQSKASKERMWAKKKANAPTIDCACGCGQKLLSLDDYGRIRKYISGHNVRTHPVGYNPKTAWVGRNRSKVNEAKGLRSRRLKVKLLTEHTEGKCGICSLEYDGKNGAIFQFHHRDPNEKEISIGGSLLTLAFATILEEIKKCDLLCGHCHTIVHMGEY